MPDQSSTPKSRPGNRSTSRGQGPKDFNQIAFEVVQKATGQMSKEMPPDPAKNPAAVTLGRLGGLKGGNARAAKLSPATRKAIAKKAAEVRWGLPKEISAEAAEEARPKPTRR
jgi:hypothetical protein